jgi:L-asparaginase
MIQIFVTGGTFDKDYNYINGSLFFKDTHIPEMLERGRCTLDIDVKTLMMVDSLDMKEADRLNILHNCQSTVADKMVVTHGTDRMVETATYLARAGIKGKTIVFVGAMVPYAFGTSSDGFFNLGSALAFAQSCAPGVYIAMNGRCFQWNEVKKNKKTGFFEPL